MNFLKEKAALALVVFLVAVQISVTGENFGLKKESEGGHVKGSSVYGAKQNELATEGVYLPIKWSDLGQKMIEAGVIDEDKFETLYAKRGGLDTKARELLYGNYNDKLYMNEKNAGLLLNLLWAFGLANKNSILEEGEMQNPLYGGDPSRFASVGGWLLSKGGAMDHYSKHAFVNLSATEQERVKNVSEHVFRPCCDNPTHFPDCNHGMAMLGLLELLASRGASEEEMYKVALSVNSLWFPDAYVSIADYLRKREVEFDSVSPKEILSESFSSSRGLEAVLAELSSPQSDSGSCGA